MQSESQKKNAGDMSAGGARLAGLVVALALGSFLYQRAHSAWTNYWLLNDPQQGTATIVGERWSGHNAVDYWYEVGPLHYQGHSSRNWKDPKKVQVGEHATVYYSASHPWISRLYQPDSVLEGFPVILIVLGLEAFAVITVVNPRSGWAFSLMKKENDDS